MPMSSINYPKKYANISIENKPCLRPLFEVYYTQGGYVSIALTTHDNV